MSTLQILVRPAVSYIDSKLVPVFDPPIQDERKYWGDERKFDFPSLFDPAYKFVLLQKIEI